MKKFVVFFTVILFALGLSAEAVFKFKERKIDFGEVNSGKVVKIVFEFENVGDSALEIKNINTSCGCTYTTLKKKIYESGEKGKLPVKFFSKGYRGKVIKTITISSNDKKNPYLRLTITGVVKLKDFAVAEIEKDTIDFGNIAVSERPSSVVKIKNAGNIDMMILEVSHSPEVSTEFDKKIVKAGEYASVKITFFPFQKGYFSTFLRIRTNAFKRPLVILRVRANIKTGRVERKELEE